MERNSAVGYLGKTSQHMEVSAQVEGSFAQRHDIHWARKIWHFSTGFTGLLLYINFDFAATPVAIACISFAVAFLLLDTVRFNSPKLNQLFCRVTRPILRGSEVNHYGGHSFYLLGVGLSLILFREEIAILAVLFLVFADPLSSLVGGVYGKEKILPHKSLEGTLTCFIVCYALSFFYLKYLGVSNSHLVLYCLGGGVFGALSELVSTFKIDDNLTIPVISGFGLTVLNNVLGIL